MSEYVYEDCLAGALRCKSQLSLTGVYTSWGCLLGSPLGSTGISSVDEMGIVYTTYSVIGSALWNMSRREELMQEPYNLQQVLPFCLLFIYLIEFFTLLKSRSSLAVDKLKLLRDMHPIIRVSKWRHTCDYLYSFCRRFGDDLVAIYTCLENLDNRFLRKPNRTFKSVHVK